MKSISNLLLLVFMLFVVCLTACKKYPDGPLLSLESKERRVINVWKYDQVYKNGVNESLTYHDLNFRLKFFEGGNASKEEENGSSTTVMYSGTWEFADHKKKIRTILTYTIYAGFTGTEITEYTILKLKEKELWLQETDSKGNLYEYHFIPE